MSALPDQSLVNEFTPEDSQCFHCGLPVPTHTDYSIIIDGQRRALCCPGCQAVVQAIVAGNLTDFYRHRTEPARRAEELVPEPLRDLVLYDRPEVQQSFVRSQGESIREASLLLEGIVCAACVWLNERHVNALPGVQAFHVNYATHRARLTWDERKIRLSEILAAIAAIGYRAHPFDPERQESVQRQERATALRRLAVAGIGAVQVMMLAVAMYGGDYYGMDEDIRRFLRWVSLLITVPVLLYASSTFFIAAWRDLRRFHLGMDVPVSLAIGGAFAASLWYTWRGGGEVYFDSITMFTFFLLAGRFLEMSVRHRAGRMSEERARLLPATAIRLTSEGTEEGVMVSTLVPGDRIVIRPGDTVPVDGHILEGKSQVDESLLTGESAPLPKHEGDPLVGGSVNRDSPLVMAVDRVGTETVLSSLLRLLDRAQSEKPQIALLADRMAGWFVAAVLLIAMVVAGWWWSHDPELAIRITLSVLVVTCPCALSLATPTAITAATSSLTRVGLLATRGHALETLARVTHMIFDKTGTLTHGRPNLVAVNTVGKLDSRRCLAIAAALERGSEHPVGQALSAAADGDLRATDLHNTPGEGIEGRIEGNRYRIGTPDFVTALSGISLPVKPVDATATWVTLGDERGLLAWLQLADTLRADALETITALRAKGMEVNLLSGDQPATVDYMAKQLGLPAEGGLLPAAKLERIRALQKTGAVVAMVGDGINDTPVLSAAQVSIAMGSGTQLAHAAADMVLLSDKLSVLVQGVEMGRRTLAIIRQNMGWAIGYNLVALPLAAAGWVAPWMAALGMSLSSLLVVVNALRLKKVYNR